MTKTTVEHYWVHGSYEGWHELCHSALSDEPEDGRPRRDGRAADQRCGICLWLQDRHRLPEMPERWRTDSPEEQGSALYAVIATLLEQSRSLLNAAHRWTKSAVAVDAGGRPVDPLSARARAWGLDGAIHVMAARYRRSSFVLPHRVGALVCEELGAHHGQAHDCLASIGGYSQGDRTTHRDVLTLLERAIRRAQAHAEASRESRTGSDEPGAAQGTRTREQGVL